MKNEKATHDSCNCVSGFFNNYLTNSTSTVTYLAAVDNDKGITLMTSTTTGTFKTGDKAPVTGRYEFVRYTDGTTTPAPTAEERVIPLSLGEVFPPIRSTNKGAWWRLM